MSKQINTTNWEVEFNRKFGLVYCSKAGAKLFAELRETSRCLKEMKAFIKDLLASSQKDKEKAVEKPKFINYSFGTSEGLTNLANAIVYAADKITEALNSKGQQ